MARKKYKGMDNNIIRFSFNWNGKLNNRAFTTIRIHNPNKYTIGKTYQIELNGKPNGKATLQDKRVLRVDQLNRFICYLDTGYSQTETMNILKRMYKTIDLQTALFDFCLLVYTTPNKQEIKDLQATLELWYYGNIHRNNTK